jgi:hypothetical protein
MGAQEIYKEGCILNLKGDTIKGFLLVQKGKNASEKCLFKQTIDGESKTYNPNEIAGYRYSNSKYYISKEINIDSINKKIVFLEFLIKGTASVYYYFDNAEHYYIEKDPNGLIELSEKERLYHDEKKGGTFIVPSKYKNKLTVVMQDCPGISEEIKNSRLNHKSLIKLTKDYHEKVCNSESCIIYERDNTSPKVKFGVLMGFSKKPV